MEGHAVVGRVLRLVLTVNKTCEQLSQGFRSWYQAQCVPLNGETKMDVNVGLTTRDDNVGLVKTITVRVDLTTDEFINLNTDFQTKTTESVRALILPEIKTSAQL